MHLSLLENTKKVKLYSCAKFKIKDSQLFELEYGAYTISEEYLANAVYELDETSGKYVIKCQYCGEILYTKPEGGVA